MSHSHERQGEKGYFEGAAQKAGMCGGAWKRSCPRAHLTSKERVCETLTGGPLASQETPSGCLGGERSRVEAASEGEGDDAVPSRDSALY